MKIFILTYNCDEFQNVVVEVFSSGTDAVEEMTEIARVAFEEGQQYDQQIKLTHVYENDNGSREIAIQNAAGEEFDWWVVTEHNVKEDSRLG